MKDILSVASGVILIIAYFPYIYAIVKGKAKPVKATWIIWSMIDIIAFLGMYQSNAINGQIVGAVIGASIVAGLSLKHGVPGWKKVDVLCLISGAVGILIWQLLNNPTIAIVIALGINVIGSVPTFVSVWEDPHRENKTAWILFLISCVLALYAIPKWTIADAAQPIIFFVIGITTISLILCSSHKKGKT